MGSRESSAHTKWPCPAPVQAAHAILRKPSGALAGDPARPPKPHPSCSSPAAPALPKPLPYPPLETLESVFCFAICCRAVFPSLSFRSLSGILLHTEVGKNSMAASGNLVSRATWHQWVILQVSTWLPRHRQLCLWKSSWYRLGASLALKAQVSFSGCGVLCLEEQLTKGGLEGQVPCQVLGGGAGRGASDPSPSQESRSILACTAPTSSPGGLSCA